MLRVCFGSIENVYHYNGSLRSSFRTNSDITLATSFIILLLTLGGHYLPCELFILEYVRSHLFLIFSSINTSGYPSKVLCLFFIKDLEYAGLELILICFLAPYRRFFIEVSLIVVITKVIVFLAISFQSLGLRRYARETVIF